MVIDMHTHTFPEKIAGKVLDKLATAANSTYFADGTNEGLRGAMDEAGVDYAVLMPVATNSQQYEKINKKAFILNEQGEENGLFSFAAIHPDNSNFKEILNEAARNGVKGIKLHPVYQETEFDDIRYMRLIDYACSLGLMITVHAGYDVGYPGDRKAAPEHILPVLNTVKPEKMILAHMGGWRFWDEVEEQIAGRDVYLDTSYSLGRITSYAAPRTPQDSAQMSREQFLRIVKKHGADKILFGSDSPWSSQKTSLQDLESIGLSDIELSQIKGENARILLGL